MNSDVEWMRRAIAMSRRSPADLRAFSVGAVVVSGDGVELASGFSREYDAAVHAEEAAIGKLPTGLELDTATLYSTLEPCSRRASRAVSCTEHILAAGIGRVVIAWREPPLFVPDCQGVALLVAGGVDVVELPELAAEARAVNAHLGV